MSQQNAPRKNTRQSILNMTLAIVAGQVGCLTLVISVLAVFIGLWLDSQFQTRPAFTIGLLLGSIPVSLLAMFFVARAAIARIKTQNPDPLHDSQRED